VKDAEETYEPVVPMRTENRRLKCPGTRRREAGNKTTYRSKEHDETRNSEKRCQQNLTE
jgi:hypothetical protein